ncbi:MAG TPA: glycoside hydrolase family 76 protein [Hanamia sp.]|nr:glycoside hydrolase family 76 protein [Hanamia sp.]
MMKKIILIFSCLSVIIVSVKAQPKAGVYQARIGIINKNIEQRFFDSSKRLFYEAVPVESNEKAFSYLWPLCALIQAANEAEVLSPSEDYMTSALNAIDQYYNNNPPTPGYQAYVTALEKSDRYYDDNQWIAIACLDAYQRTQKIDFLNKAKLIYRFMMSGYDSASGGGIYWKEGDKTSKNTCSNGPGILVALQLYNITKSKPCLDTALLLYNWVNAHLESPEGIYYDNIRIPSLKIDSATYTYNTGTMLQSNVLLYKITHEKKYLVEAQRIAKAAKNHFYKNNRLPGNYWFNVVLLRGYIELYKVDRNKSQLQFFIDDAERIWKDERDANNLLGKNNKIKSLIDQAAMIEIYARLAALEN